MERNTVTIIGELTIGDRFYKVGDKSKTTYEKVERPGIGFRINRKAHYALWVGIADKTSFDNRARATATKEFREHTPVIYLRHKTEQ